MSDAFARRLSHGAALTDEDRALLAPLSARTRHVGRRQDLVREGDPVETVHLVTQGIACRYKGLANGARQITDYLLPGDACHLHMAILEEADHSIATLTACSIAEISHSALEAVVAHSPRLARALWWSSLVSESTAREWVLNVGRRQAAPRMAHLFCELLVRLQAVGLADANSYDLPLTQNDLADTLGLTSVHVNRTLMDLRKAKLIELKARRLTVLDVARLKAVAEFKPNYLHLRARPGSVENEA